ncbi:MAG: hypothetical protein J6U12_00945 [Candidatus Methanomethylophilaceae archaeon]|nr:hypothetical protein [Candidatus Methanomethylophilaceae archaeon]MBO7351480.1 hypothetical protein [Candidatus Methanomethylophilaceae archaeon]
MGNVTYEMRMPTNYTDMSVAEMQYDGGFSWKTFGLVLAVVGAVAFFGGFGLAYIGTTSALCFGTGVAGIVGGLAVGTTGLAIMDAHD